MVLESARRVGTEAELRFVNYLTEEREVAFTSPGDWARVDLAGEVQDGAFDAAAARAVGGGMLSIRRAID